MLVGLVLLFMVLISLFLGAAPSRLLLLLLLVAAASSATMLPAGPLSTILALFLVSPFIFSLLPFYKLLNLPAILEVMALGAMDLAIFLVEALWLVGSCQGLAGGTPGNLLVGV